MSAIPASRPEFSPLDENLRQLKDSSRAFAKLPVADKIQMLQELRAAYRAIAEESVIASCRAKGLDPDSALAGEEWISGPMTTIRNMRLLIDSLKDVQKYGAPQFKPHQLRTLSDGRLSVEVFPTDAIEGAVLAGVTAQVHMQPGVTKENLAEHQASFYRKPHEGRVCLVLGAGNLTSIPPMDALYKMFVEGSVVILKMNPVNAYAGPFIERAFAAPIQKGFFKVVYGGIEESAFLVNHPLVDEIHMTGSDKTHDLLVWGPPGAERDARMAKNEPLLKRDITSELGDVSPVMLVPGPYSKSEMDFQGRNVAGMLSHNASFNCTGVKLLVTPKTWEGRNAFLDAVARGLEMAPMRKAYYPGADTQWHQLTKGRPDLRLIGKPGPGELAYALVPNIDASNPNETALNQEPWCPVMSETTVDANDPIAFIEKAVELVNERVWGTLSATFVVHPKTLEDPKVAAAFEQAIFKLRYGTVTVNTWGGVAYGLVTPPWGGHPSSTLKNIQSGRGFVHNTFMLEDVEKCVVTGPLKFFPPGLWFPGHRTANHVGKRLVDFEMGPSWLKVPGLAFFGLRG